MVGQASNGQEALQLVESLKPDVVVTDLEMPVMDGAEFIAQQLQRRFLPMIVFSAVRYDSPLSIRARKSGAVAHVVKPTAMGDVQEQQRLLRDQIFTALAG